MPGVRDPDVITLSGTWHEKWTQRQFLRLARQHKGPLYDKLSQPNVIRLLLDRKAVPYCGDCGLHGHEEDDDGHCDNCGDFRCDGECEYSDEGGCAG